MATSVSLADPDLEWSTVDETAFEVRCRARGQEAIVRFEVDGQDDVVLAHSPSRPCDIAGGFASAPWSIDFSEHQEFGGVRIPATAAATFHMDDGPWEYLRVRVTSLEQSSTWR